MTDTHTTDLTAIERLTTAAEKLPALAPAEGEDLALAYARYAIDAALTEHATALATADNRQEGYAYDWSVVHDLVSSESTLQIWFDVLAFGSSSREADGLEITRDAITEMARRAARNLLSNRYMASSSDPMSNAISSIKATAEQRFVEAFGKDLTIAEVTAF